MDPLALEHELDRPGLIETVWVPATHRCKICGARWRLFGPGYNGPNEPRLTRAEYQAIYGQTFTYEGSWSCLTIGIMRKCCDNEPMGDQIERFFDDPEENSNSS